MNSTQTPNFKPPHESIFLFTCRDKPASVELRHRVRAVHMEYMIAVLDITVFGGPLRNDADTQSHGSIFALKLPNRAAAMAFLENEPYNKAGLFELVSIELWRQMAPERYEGALMKEYEREKRRDLKQRA